ncbi:hypothetical protein OS493_028575 [Desmophyllum pertusum]|uniref:Uncharacterized protein n=1 Tax=Desmophyllum pertusum TaxID=174260 RepID=A0A9X0CP66_9CNID|nr:hypothetical protein OS493_028575 [Desmophyllum pertusum]
MASMYNKSDLAGIVSHATNQSTPSTSTASILKNSHHNGASTQESSNYHLPNSKSSILTVSSSASVAHMSTNTIAFKVFPSWNRSIMATVHIIQDLRRLEALCTGSTVLVLDTSQISFTLTRDVADRTLLTKETATGNSMSNPPSNGITYSSSTPSMESQHATATTAAATPGSRINVLVSRLWLRIKHTGEVPTTHPRLYKQIPLEQYREAISYSTSMDRGATRSIIFSNPTVIVKFVFHYNAIECSSQVRPTDDSVAPTALQFPWHLIPFLVIIFLIIVVLITYYLHIPDVIYAIILAIKEKRRQMKASKPNTNLDLTKGNFSTEGFKASPFHSHQREMSVCEEPLNYAIFETAAMKAIEFSVFLDEEGPKFRI